MQAHFQRLFEHMAWADALVLERLQASPPSERMLALFAHVLAAERVWLTRLRGGDSVALEIWPQLSLQQCAALADQMRRSYTEYVDNLDPERLSSPVTYRNSKGVEFTTSVQDILTHVAMHGSYHRGQIASSLRAAGGEPVNTDFITFARENTR